MLVALLSQNLVYTNAAINFGCNKMHSVMYRIVQLIVVMSVRGEMKGNDETKSTDFGEMSQTHVCRSFTGCCCRLLLVWRWRTLTAGEVVELRVG